MTLSYQLPGADKGPAGGYGTSLGAASSAGVRPRIESIDILRGLVMILMALDHTRDFFGAGGMTPRDINDPSLFMTRWITHFCAPLFVLLAGVSAYLYGERGRTAGEVSRFLLIRGFWLMLIEFTLVRLGWTFDAGPGLFFTQVIWVLGASMIVLAGLIHLPRWAILAVALAMIFGHNTLDGVQAESFGSASWMWNLLHQPRLFELGGGNMYYAVYPLIPWAGVMAAGYLLGALYRDKAASRRRWLVILGSLSIILFVVLRASNLYGDPDPWVAGEDLPATILSFINCEKYPPSLLYLAMTLGPGLLLLAVLEGLGGRLCDWIATFGRVPFLYYLAHVYLIHTLAVVFALVTIGDASWLFGGLPDKPEGYGLGLPGVYLVTLGIVGALYPLCRAFAALKQRRGDWWLSYL